MDTPRFLLGLDNIGVAFLVIDVLPSAKRSAHGSADQQCGFLLVEHLLRLGSHARPGEVPWLVILVWHREIERQSRNYAVFWQLFG